MPNNEETFALKIVNDLEKAITTFTIANSFDIIPEVTNDTNTSPVYGVHDTIGFDSWAVKYVVPYAHRKLIENKLEKPVDLEVLRPCILALNLLHPEMPTAWNTRRELVVSKKLSTENDLQLTKLVLSRAPNCNEPLSYRRWLIKNNLVKGEADNLLAVELSLIHRAADKHHCNFHAWSHWSWCLKHFAPLDGSDVVPSGNKANVMSYKDFNSLFETPQLVFFYHKLKANTIFFSKHVTDYSSICQRMHLIEQIFKIIDHGVANIDGNFDDEDHEIVEFVEAVHDVNLDTTDSEDEDDKTVFELYKHLKLPILEVLRCSDDINVKEYISQNKINVKLGFILRELKFNEQFIRVFQNIEAMLYYRRFLIFTLNNLLSAQAPSLESVVNKLYSVIVYEKTLIELLVTDTSYYKRVVENYKRWLQKIVFKDDCNRCK